MRPALAGAAGGTTSATPSGQGKASRTVAARILVVDDDLDMVATCAQVLAQHGYVCLTASAGSEAIAVMDAERPDLVVTDLHMPGVDGLAVARHARTRIPPIPVVLMTTWPAPTTVREGLLAGAAAHLGKPFANAHLVGTVRHVLGEAGSGHLTGFRRSGRAVS
ncbi:MAG TPA: response regulator [Methylomirabilota bacterium]|nr:response regulator [Methylomirabilota bacterium]